MSIWTQKSALIQLRTSLLRFWLKNLRKVRYRTFHLRCIGGRSAAPQESEAVAAAAKADWGVLTKEAWVAKYGMDADMCERVGRANRLLRSIFAEAVVAQAGKGRTTRSKAIEVIAASPPERTELRILLRWGSLADGQGQFVDIYDANGS